MITGAALVLFKWSLSVNIWDLLILMATMFPPLWNYYVQKARKAVSSSVIMFLRSLISSILFFTVSYFFGLNSNMQEVYKALPFLFVNWFLILWFGRILWIEATHRISIQKAVSLQTISPVFTLIFAFFMLWEIPNWWQVIWFVPIIIWSIFIIK